MTEAAAMDALRWSPPTTARWAGARGPRRKPSTRQTAGQGSIAARARASRRRLVLCRPSRSIVAGLATRTTTWSAWRRIASATRPRTSGARRLESSRSLRQRRPRAVSPSRSRQTAATTSGPARQPRPASSAPATRRTPNARSCANRRAAGRRPLPARRAAATPDPGPGPGGLGALLLADAGLPADLPAQVVELGSVDVALHHPLDPLDLRRVEREGALDAD